MKKRHLLTLCALLLCLSLLLQGCTPLAVLFGLGEAMMDAEESTQTAATDENLSEQPEDSASPTTPEQPTESQDPVSENAIERLEESFLEPIPFSQISYSRPDADKLCKDFQSIQSMVEDGKSAQDIVDAFEPIYEEYCYFYTLSDYAYIRYTLDLNDSYYDEEYNWCEEQSPVIEQAMEKCYIAMSESSIRSELESLYFGEGFFEFYDDNRIYSNDRVVELMQEESALQTEYMSLQNETTILWEGEERLVSELLDDPNLGYASLLSVYTQYYAKYNPLASDIFIKLIKIRKEIASELEYDSYADFAYAYTYKRDYTPEQVAQYTDDIAYYLSDYYYTAIYNSYSSPMDTDTVMSSLKDVAYELGGEFEAAYDFMEKYELYDISSSPSKMPGSYMSYLTSYGMPYMYVSPTDDIGDLLTAAHEFGHFTDGYINCGQNDSIDCAEVFSQGLEYLALDIADLSNQERESLAQSKLSDSLLVFLGQGCYAEFEQMAYSLPDDQLTAENINKLFLDCNNKFGMGGYGMDSLIAPGWIDIQHFFIAPYYVISYCVSNDASLQIYEVEQSEGRGLEVYLDLLHNAADNTLLAMLEEAEMDSPFASGRMANLADFYDEGLN